MAKIQLQGRLSGVSCGDVGLNVEVETGLAPIDTLFIHGNLASNTWWEPSIALWKKEARADDKGRMIFAEWRGCGDSDEPRSVEDLHPSVLADDYIALLRAMHVKKASIVGHSTGGLIALYAMLKAPELFERALLLETVGARGAKFEQAQYDAFTQMSQDRDFCAAIMGATIHLNDPASPFFQRIVDETFNVSKKIWHGIPKVLSNIDITSELARVEQPVLVIWSEHDIIIERQSSVDTAAALKNGRYLELKGQGHSPNVENPRLFVNIANEFLFNRG